MAASNASWGIDIGQCALKAIRCRFDDKGTGLVAEAFDFIEYPKILSQPDAEPEQLVRDALKQFLSRNSVRGCKVGLSVPGQSGLTRFIKLPPVETKKIPDIVKYEAKQQIPFDLEDVIWDYQVMGDGPSSEMAEEQEVGLFAMKREQVFKAIRPLEDAGVELDVVQLTPLSVFNAVTHGILGADHDKSKSVVALSMGTDTTDLVVTNGERVWQRSIPIGGNHFTKQLTKELKLTFAKAEHLKRNAQEAEDPKAVFQAMRSVFGDLVTEVQRSIGYFQGIHRGTEIERMIVLGNAFKLPGLPQYLSKNLGYRVSSLEAFQNLSGSSVVDAPSFKDNVLSFPVAYGLAVQGLGKAKLRTNLVPRELVRSRMIRRKKPWILGASSLVLAAMSLSYLSATQHRRAALPENFSQQKSQVDQVKQQSGSFTSEDEALRVRFDGLKKLGDEVVRDSDGRFLVMELYKAINDSLPKGPGVGQVEDLRKVNFNELPELHLTSVDMKYFAELGDWYTTDVAEKYAQYKNNDIEGLKADAAEEGEEEEAAEDTEAATDGADAAGAAAAGTDTDAAAPDAAAADATAAAADAAAAPAAEGDAAAGEEGAEGAEGEGGDEPKGPGWVIQLKGWHLHNKAGSGKPTGAQYVRESLLKQLDAGTVQLPVGRNGEMEEFTMRELGVSHPILVSYEKPRRFRIEDPEWQPPMDMFSSTGVPGVPGVQPAASATPGTEAKKDEPKREQYIEPLRCKFTVQMAWQERRLSERMEARLRASAAGAAGATDAAGDSSAAGDSGAEASAPASEPSTSAPDAAATDAAPTDAAASGDGAASEAAPAPDATAPDAAAADGANP